MHIFIKHFLAVIFFILKIITVIVYKLLSKVTYFLFVKTFQRNLSEVIPNAKFDVDNVTEHSFIQGYLGNCGMIAAMASLANNRELINKVVPPDQNFKNVSNSDIKKPSQFRFYLYKNGKAHVVVVNESLYFWNRFYAVYTLPLALFWSGWRKRFWNNILSLQRLYYSNSCNQNSVGPFLEKALIKLLFNGNYELAHCVDPKKVFTHPKAKKKHFMKDWVFCNVN